jgi:hypothetical protein
MVTTSHKTLRRLAVVFTLAVSVLACFAQETEAPRKPLRERLLERAQKGDVEAQFDLGKNYETGRIGLPRDLAQAQHWYREAANQGDPFAEASLGILYNFGKGVERDYFQAYIWYERAVLHLTGADRDTVVEMRDRIAGKLTSTQLEDARRQAREWKPTPAH